MMHIAKRVQLLGLVDYVLGWISLLFENAVCVVRSRRLALSLGFADLVYSIP